MSQVSRFAYHHWRYDHSPTEPEETFGMTCRVAATFDFIWLGAIGMGEA